MINKKLILNMPSFNDTSAFTIAEVLITLGIIGIIAALTIPALINKTNDLEMQIGLKKNYSLFSQLVQKIASDNSGSLKNVFPNVADGRYVNLYSPYLQYSKICSSNIDTGGCWHSPGKWYDYNGALPTIITSQFYSQQGGIVLNDGTLVLVSAGSDGNCTRGWMAWENSGDNNYPTCTVVFVDVNGFKGPNRAGKDIFELLIQEPGKISGDLTIENTLGIGCAGKIMRGQTCP